MFVKKLNDKLRPSNIETDENNEILTQQIPDEQSKGSNVFLGYTVTKDYARITGIYAVCIYGNALVWVTDLAMLGGSNLAATLISIKPKGSGPQLKDGIVKVRKNKRE